MIQSYGRIFTPQDYNLNYSKSPQPLVFDDYVRVFFSYCVPDCNKLKSKVGYVDYDLGFQKILKVFTEVMPDGTLGSFDEHGIFPFSPFIDDGRLLAVTTGWSRRLSVSVDTSIGLSESFDNGETFNRIGSGPILTATYNEPFLIADGYVLKHLDTYYMYYIFGTKWADYSASGQPERTYKIAVAKSSNLLDWERDGIQLIADRIQNEAQALPSVIRHNHRWHMAFCYRDTIDFRTKSERGYRIGYAVSDDLITWQRNDNVLSIPTSDWDNDMQCYPCLFKIKDELFMLYNGNHFAKEGFGLVKLEDL